MALWKYIVVLAVLSLFNVDKSSSALWEVDTKDGGDESSTAETPKSLNTKGKSRVEVLA
ncbi:hypothetical protein TSMEX_003844 [Taenia solium]|eukprot:TsM_000410300 transcript=TsM_000410300 gene=TsM_000410300